MPEVEERGEGGGARSIERAAMHVGRNRCRASPPPPPPKKNNDNKIKPAAKLATLLLLHKTLIMEILFLRCSSVLYRL